MSAPPTFQKSGPKAREGETEVLSVCIPAAYPIAAVLGTKGANVKRLEVGTKALCAFVWKRFGEK